MPTHYKGTQSERAALDVFIKLFRAADAVARRIVPIVEAHGLTASQFGALETLYHLGPMKGCELAAKHLKSRNNFSVIIDNLERAGLVTKERDAHDRRAILVALTPAGREKIEAAIPLHVAEVERIMSALSVEEQKTLQNLLRKLGKAAATSDRP